MCLLYDGNKESLRRKIKKKCHQFLSKKKSQNIASSPKIVEFKRKPKMQVIYDHEYLQNSVTTVLGVRSLRGSTRAPGGMGHR